MIRLLNELGKQQDDASGLHTCLKVLCDDVSEVEAHIVYLGVIYNPNLTGGRATKHTLWL